MAGELKAEPGKDEWTFHVYDLSALTTPVPQFVNPGTLSPARANQPESFDSDAFISLLKQSTGLKNWTSETATIREFGGQLLVSQRDEIHTRIGQALTALIKEKRTQVRIEIRLLKSSKGVEQPLLSATEINELITKLGPDAEVNRTQVVCYNKQCAMTFGGREETYLEDFIANNAGGGTVAGLREASGSPLLEGLTTNVIPSILWDSGNVELTLRISLVSNVSFRKLTLLEKMLVDAKAAARQGAEATPKKLTDDEHDLFRIPHRDASRLGTQVVVPKCKWMLAGTVTTAEKEKNLLHVFVYAEVIGQ